MNQIADARFLEQAQLLGYSFDGEIKIGGNYMPLVRDGHHLYVSGQTPRVGSTVVVTGAVGRSVEGQLPKNASVEIDLIASVKSR